MTEAPLPVRCDSEQQREVQHRDGELRPGSGGGIVIRRLGSQVPLLVH